MIHPKKIVSLLIFTFMVTGLIWGQEWPAPCGTPDIHSEMLKEWRASRGQIISLRNEDPLHVKMKIHIVGDDDGEGFYLISDLLESYCKLNQDMSGAGIVMEMDPDINYISNSQYFMHDFQSGAQMMNRYNEPGMVNCYIVADPAGNCGYYSPSQDGVALKKTCLGSGTSTWAHELGHFFSLPHTFSGWEGTAYTYDEVAPNRVGNRNRLVELADSSNCNSAADGFCDTKADYLSFRWSCTGGLSPGNLVDPDNNSFRAEGANIMSYSNGTCPAIFSQEQIDAMQFDITRGRLSHISQNEIRDPLDFSSEDFEPLEGMDEEPLQYDNATIRWKAVEGADEYVVQLTRVLPFSTPPSFEFRTSDTVMNFDFLDIDFFYDWEVIPFHFGDGCAPGSGKNRFLATQLSSNSNTPLPDAFSVFPNPVHPKSRIQVQFKGKITGEITLELLDAQSKLVSNKFIKVSSGANRFEILAPSTPGLYFLRLISEDGIRTRKVIVN